jgi:hypothetical protein
MLKNLLMYEEARKDKETQNADNLFFAFLSFDSIVSIFLPFLPLPLHFFYHYVFPLIYLFIYLFQQNKLYLVSIALAMVDCESGIPLPSAVSHFFLQSALDRH